MPAPAVRAVRRVARAGRGVRPVVQSCAARSTDIGSPAAAGHLTVAPASRVRGRYALSTSRARCRRVAAAQASTGRSRGACAQPLAAAPPARGHSGRIPTGQDAWTIKATASGRLLPRSHGLLRDGTFGRRRIGTPGRRDQLAMAERFWPAGSDRPAILVDRRRSRTRSSDRAGCEINNCARRSSRTSTGVQPRRRDLTLVARTSTDDRGAATAVREAVARRAAVAVLRS